MAASVRAKPLRSTAPEHPPCGAARVTGIEWDAFASKQGGTAKPSPLRLGRGLFYFQPIFHRKEHETC